MNNVSVKKVSASGAEYPIPCCKVEVEWYGAVGIYRILFDDSIIFLNGDTLYIEGDWE